MNTTTKECLDALEILKIQIRSLPDQYRDQLLALFGDVTKNEVQETKRFDHADQQITSLRGKIHECHRELDAMRAECDLMRVFVSR